MTTYSVADAKNSLPSTLDRRLAAAASALGVEVRLLQAEAPG